MTTNNGNGHAPANGATPERTPPSPRQHQRARATQLQGFLYLLIALGGIGGTIFRKNNASPGARPTHLRANATTTTTGCDCNCLVRPLRSPSPDPGTINRLRRHLALDHPGCYQAHLPHFLHFARHRLQTLTRHLSLHIPKAGGTSLCALAKKADMETGPNNCWEGRHFMPLWADARFAEGDRRGWTADRNGTTANNIAINGNSSETERSGNGTAGICKAMDRELPAFVMDENYLDHPLCLAQRLYSVLLRDPVDRARSNEKHLMTFQAALNRSAADTAKRLALVRNNYVTWALSVGSTPHGHRLAVTPNREHLELAKDALSRFDFIMELSQNATCERTILQHMGLGEIQHLNAKQGAQVTLEGNHSRAQYERWNELDVELHAYARRLMKADCDFFLRLGEATGGAIEEGR